MRTLPEGQQDPVHAFCHAFCRTFRARVASQETPKTGEFVDSDLLSMYEACVYKGILPKNGRCNALCKGGLPLCSLPNDHARGGALLHSFEMQVSPSRKRRACILDRSERASHEEGDRKTGRPRLETAVPAGKDERCMASSDSESDAVLPDAATDDCDDLEAWLFGLSEADIDEMVQGLAG
jgi:hypothetical protein